MDIPTERSELSSLENDSIEEAKTPEKSTEGNRFLTFFKLLIGDGVIGFKHVCSDTLWRLTGCFDTILNDGNWEFVAWFSSKPQSEGAICLDVDLFKDAIKSWHEGNS